MSANYHEKICEQVRSFLQQQCLDFNESEEQYATRFDILARAGRDSCVTKVSSKGIIYNQASPNSRLKELMENFKSAIENGQPLLPPLPFDIESFPERLQANMPAVDPVIIHFLREAIICLRAGSLTGCAFLLGAASEKAIWLMIDAYAAAILDEGNRLKFKNRVSSQFISRAYDEFRRSFDSCKSRPADAALLQDLNIKMEQVFQFCRICRNEAGHPHEIPNLSSGALIANMGQFITYIETIYRLIDYFKNTPIVT